MKTRFQMELPTPDQAPWRKGDMVATSLGAYVSIRQALFPKPLQSRVRSGHV